MSGPHGSDSGQQWQPPGHGGEQPSSDQPTQVGSPWQQQPSQEATWHAPAYTPPAEYPRYQQPAEQAYPQQYPPAAPGYGQPDQFGAQPTQYGHLVSTGSPSTASTASQANTARRASLVNTDSPANTRNSSRTTNNRVRSVPSALIAGIIAAVVLSWSRSCWSLGFWEPGFFVTTKLDVNKAQAGVQQVLTDETNGYGAKNVKDVKCNNGADPTVKKGGNVRLQCQHRWCPEAA